MNEDHLALLRTLDPAVNPDDGAAMAAVVADFQTLAGLPQDGVWSAATAAAADETLELARVIGERRAAWVTLQRGDMGDVVRELQRLVRAPVSGVFDADTERRVRRVRQAAGLPPSGVADYAVWASVANT